MKRLLGHGVWLSALLVLVFSCSSETRHYASGGAGSGGEDSLPDAGAGRGGGSPAGSGSAGTIISAAGNSSGGASGQAGADGTADQAAAGEAGAGGATSGTCIAATTRTCAQAGLVGKCAVAGAIETCTAAGTWGACSVAPSPADSCVAGNNDNCTGAANEGCQCINGVTKRACGACNDGTQVCTDGKTNTYGPCTGAVLQPTTYYRDADGDGFGSAASTVVCGGPPAGYTDQTGDCCDDGGDLAQAKTIFPGQTKYFSTAATICNVGWNYNCSAGGSIETFPPDHIVSCAPSDCTATISTNTASNCGVAQCAGGCTVVGPPGTPCSLYCGGGNLVVTCH